MTRIGTGYDVHQLGEGLPLWLGGVLIPHTHGLVGHSDADVLTHAICDALLGAAALGDIGKHFPDTDPQYKGISSLKLLAHVCHLLGSHGYRIVNIDSTIVAQKPKLQPYIESIRNQLATTMTIGVDYVSVKATTTEHLGPEGRGESISAQAIALIETSR